MCQDMSLPSGLHIFDQEASKRLKHRCVTREDMLELQVGLASCMHAEQRTHTHAYALCTFSMQTATVHHMRVRCTACMTMRSVFDTAVLLQAYPKILVTAGLHDPRVAYWEPAKFVAKLRREKMDDSLLLFKCDLGAGHFSQSGRFDALKELAIDYAFILLCADRMQPPTAAL